MQFRFEVNGYVQFSNGHFGTADERESVHVAAHFVFYAVRRAFPVIVAARAVVKVEPAKQDFVVLLGQEGDAEVRGVEIGVQDPLGSPLVVDVLLDAGVYAVADAQARSGFI